MLNFSSRNSKNIYFIFFFSLLIIILPPSIIKCDQKGIYQIEAYYNENTNEITYQGKTFILSPVSSFQVIKETNNPLESEPKEIEKAPLFSARFWFYFVSFVVLACFAGCMSGLTVGLLSIDSLFLELKQANASEKERKYIERIKGVIDHHHWLLVTLLLCNSFACEAMPIVLDKLVSEIVAIVLSVTVLLFVGEIIPQALCTGPRQMQIASALAPFTKFLMYLTYIVSYPIAMFMDCVIGVQGPTRFTSSELKTLIEKHIDNVDKESNVSKTGLDQGQANIMIRALDNQRHYVKDIMIPIKEVKKIDYDETINGAFINKIKKFHRYPVYDEKEKCFFGILHVKRLLGFDFNQNIALRNSKIKLDKPEFFQAEDLIYDILECFKTSHMAFVVDDKNKEEKKIIGIVTLNDCINPLIKSTIRKQRIVESVYYDYYHDVKFKEKKDVNCSIYGEGESFINNENEENMKLISSPLIDNRNNY